MTEREMFDKLRAGLSLEKFVNKIGSKSTTAFWSLYDRGLRPLSTVQKNELRAAMGVDLILDLKLESETLIDAGGARVVGEQPFEILVFVGQRTGRVVITRNNQVSLVAPEKKTRLLNVRPRASKEQDEERIALGATWQDVVKMGLKGLREAKWKRNGAQ